ncbi:MAG TPA: hypothetical protein VJ397_08700 [Thermoplasmata archaeon]|nr:hypothetical protein [Thermoplasmata archaeon]
MTTRVVVQRSALKGLLAHAAAVAKASRAEALGWLLGFFTEDAVYVVESAGCTRYRSQTRYGAEAEPTEEAEIATRFPRQVGIVGLYHSHPFRDEAQHAMFHSHTDDATLRSRASRRELYLSAVTDTREATFYVLRRGRPHEVRPEVVEEVRCGEVLRRYTARVGLRGTHTLNDLRGLLPALETDLTHRLERLMAAGAEVVEEGERLSVQLRGTDEARTNAVRIERRDGRYRAELELLLTPTVYVDREDHRLLSALREELHDDATFLLRRALGDGVPKLEANDSFEANLGTIRVQEHRRLPVKTYRAPKRGAAHRRA